MTFTLTETSQVWGVWMMSGPGLDVMIVVAQDDPEAMWTLKGRIRCYVDNKMWDSDDTKRWFNSEPTHDVKKLVALAEAIADRMRALGGKDSVDYLPIHGGVELFSELMQTRPWCAVKSGEEAKKYAEQHPDRVPDRNKGKRKRMKL